MVSSPERYVMRCCCNFSTLDWGRQTERNHQLRQKVECQTPLSLREHFCRKNQKRDKRGPRNSHSLPSLISLSHSTFNFSDLRELIWWTREKRSYIQWLQLFWRSTTRVGLDSFLNELLQKFHGSKTGVTPDGGSETLLTLRFSPERHQELHRWSPKTLRPVGGDHRIVERSTNEVTRKQDYVWCATSAKTRRPFERNYNVGD